VRREKVSAGAEAFKADTKEWRTGQKEIIDSFSEMNAELSLRLNHDSKAAGWIAEFTVSEVSHRDRYQKGWRRLEEKYAAKASADVDTLRSKISKSLMGMEIINGDVLLVHQSVKEYQKIYC
jgi:hypothetical protein